MKKQLFTLALAASATAVCAQNPIVQTWFTSDPAPMVHNDTLYVYTGHDEDNADFFSLLTPSNSTSYLMSLASLS